MKEIKFRVWHKGDNKMYYTFNITSPTQDGCSSMVYLDISNKTVLMQYTGLKSSDEGGQPIKEAYFGDIIRFYNTEGREIQAEIIWYEEEHCIGFKRLTDGAVYTQRYFNDSGYFQPSKIKFEIIGNIYQNPELLK